MIFEIPFDSKKALGQYKLRLKLTFKKNLITSGKNLFAAGIITFFAWMTISDKSNVGYFFLALGLFYLFNAIQYFIYYIKTANKLKRIYQESVELREKNKDIMTWEFNDDFFRYKDMYYDNSIKWEAFKGYKIIQKNLFLLLAESIDQSFIIGEEEIGVQEFAMVIASINEKIKDIGK